MACPDAKCGARSVGYPLFDCFHAILTHNLLRAPGSYDIQQALVPIGKFDLGFGHNHHITLHSVQVLKVLKKVLARASLENKSTAGVKRNAHTEAGRRISSYILAN